MRASRWSFTLDFLPPSVNHMYIVNPKTGQRVITEEARGIRDEIRMAAQTAGFRPDKKDTYGIVVVLYMPDWDTSDVDSGLKALLDSALSSRTDHRVTHLLVDKRVRPRCTPRTEVEIWKLSGVWTLIAWLLRLVLREIGPVGLLNAASAAPRIAREEGLYEQEEGQEGEEEA